MRWGRQPRFSFYGRYEKYTVTDLKINTKYATGTSKLSTYSHLPRWGWLAWKDGQPVGMQVRYLCGSTSASPLLGNTATKPVCPKCLVVEAGYQLAADSLPD